MAAKHRTKTPRIVHANSATRWFGVFFLGALIGAVAWLAFDYGREWAGLSTSDSGLAVRRLRASLKVLKEEREQLHIQLAAQERSSQVDREAARAARAALRGIQQEKQELEKDIRFLRNLVDTESTGVLRIKDFKLNNRAGANRYAYAFTVTQLKEGVGLSKGRIHIQVAGLQDDNEVQLGLAELESKRADGVKMRFQHFQEVRGKLHLPEGFVPQRVHVEIKPDNRRLAPLAEAYEWAVAG